MAKESIKDKLLKYKANQVVGYANVLGETVPVSRNEALQIFGCRIPKGD